MIKCALISGKGMGLRHGKNFSEHPDAELVAVCDMSPEVLAKAKEEFGIP
jgi:predicted dehydrogenase